MARPATSRLKVNPPLGRMPVLQFCGPGELQVDAAYQRSVEAEDSQSLIRKIAMFWNWDLCLPLVVSRRRTETGEALFVIDGQHRLEAARLRGDIPQLPCMVKEYGSAADEAASFVHLNQQRRPLSKLDLFKAAVASEDPQALAIAAAMAKAGLSLAPHMSSVAWKPGQLGNIGGIEHAWRNHGALAASEALEVLAAAFAGQVLKYAGTLYPGIVAVCAEEVRGRKEFDPGRFASFSAKLGARGQDRLRLDGAKLYGDFPDLGRTGAQNRVIAELWWPERKAAPEKHEVPRPTLPQPPVSRAALEFKPDASGMAWCDQCDMRVGKAQAEGCRSRFCSLRGLKAA